MCLQLQKKQRRKKKTKAKKTLLTDKSIIICDQTYTHVQCWLVK